MDVVDGNWTMYGVNWDDPECLHTVEDAINYINEIGFLPLFSNEIPGFSLEERTVPEFWWCEDPSKDPWIWREIIARTGEIAYGKFFNKKNGFISKKWLPYYVNYRRDGYDFDAKWDDELASMREKKIMDLFMDENADNVIMSNLLKDMAGFGKGKEKGFDSTMTGLMMQTYLCMYDFKRKRNKKGEEYGWNMACYATPEHIFGAELVTSRYNEKPKDSYKAIVDYIKDVYPIAEEKAIHKLIKR